MPSFDPEGRYLYFLSLRDFDPVYDNLHFDLGFPFGMRPHLITLRDDLPSPFIPQPKPLFEEGSDESDEADDTELGPDVEGDDMEPGDSDDDMEDGEGDEDQDDEDALVMSRGPGVARPPARSLGRGRARKVRSAIGRAADGKSKESSDKDSVEPGGDTGSVPAESGDEAPPPIDESLIQIDLEGIQDRVIGFPVPEGHYGRIAGIANKVLYSTFPLNSTLAPPGELSLGGTIECFDLETLEESTLVEPAEDFELSLDTKSLVYRSGRKLRVLKAGHKPGKEGPPSRKTGWIDLGRIRISVDPKAEWEQMYREAWRLQRDQFWTPDMSGVDWQQVYTRYLPLIQRVSTRAEFSDLMWEMQGELGTSHAYEAGGDYRSSPIYAQGYLGVDFKFDEAKDDYEVERIIRGDVWDEAASSPLARPGIDVRPGDRLIAVGGRKVNRETQPAELMVNQARNEVTLTFAPRAEEAASTEDATKSEGAAEAAAEATSEAPEADSAAPKAEASDSGAAALVSESEASESEGSDASKNAAAKDGADPTVEAVADGAKAAAPPTSFNVTVKTLSDERLARYRDWVERNRAAVLEATDGRVGYVHVPDMGPRGYAEFHRGFLSEIQRVGLIVDVRFNAGGHVSQLILEKLARRRLGYDVQRWGEPLPYPAESVLGPIVALTNEYAGSDGDMFSHAFKLMKLGPLIGKRTWGGVVGIHPREAFVDGGYTTQPEFSMWFKDVGFALENYGTEPDIEVEIRPQDHVAGNDPQLARAIQEILQRMSDEPPELPEFGERPRLPLPTLPKMDSEKGAGSPGDSAEG
jgi:tricorn protease